MNDTSRSRAQGVLPAGAPKPGDLRILKIGGGRYISEPILQQAYLTEDGSIDWRSVPVVRVSYAEYQEAREGR